MTCASRCRYLTTSPRTAFNNLAGNGIELGFRTAVGTYHAFTGLRSCWWTLRSRGAAHDPDGPPTDTNVHPLSNSGVHTPSAPIPRGA